MTDKQPRLMTTNRFSLPKLMSELGELGLAESRERAGVSFALCLARNKFADNRRETRARLESEN